MSDPHDVGSSSGTLTLGGDRAKPRVDARERGLGIAAQRNGAHPYRAVIPRSTYPSARADATIQATATSGVAAEVTFGPGADPERGADADVWPCPDHSPMPSVTRDNQM